jgi:putative NADH-flavin reductase
MFLTFHMFKGDTLDDELLKKLIPKVDTGTKSHLALAGDMILIVYSCIVSSVIGMARVSPRQEWAKKICAVIQGMNKKDRPRYIHIAGAGILSTGEKTLVRDGWFFWLFAPADTKTYTVEHFETWEFLKTDADDLEWVLFCPPFVNDKPSSKGYKAVADVPAGFLGSGVKNEDVTAYLVDEVEKPRPSDFNHKRVGISSK